PAPHAPELRRRDRDRGQRSLLGSVLPPVLRLGDAENAKGAARARVSAAVNTAISATGPIGFVGAGLLLQHASLRATYAVVAGSATVGAAIVVVALSSPAQVGNPDAEPIKEGSR